MAQVLDRNPIAFRSDHLVSFAGITLYQVQRIPYSRSQHLVINTSALRQAVPLYINYEKNKADMLVFED